MTPAIQTHLRTAVTTATPRHRTPLFAILLLAVLLRVTVALYLGNDLSDWRGGTADQISYDALAQRVAGGYGFSFAQDWWPYARAGQPTAFWSYLYTLYLTSVYTIFGHSPLAARLVQATVVGLLTPWLTYRIGNRTFGKQVGLIGAGIVAVYAYQILYAASLMSEAFYMVGILWNIDVSLRLAQAMQGRQDTQRASIWLGIELGTSMAITLLLRQVIIVFYPFLAMWLLWQAARQGVQKRVVSALSIATVTFLFLISPFVARNYLQFDRWVLPNTNAGFTFFWSNHPIYGTQFEAVLSPDHDVSYQDLIPSELRNLNEADLDRALLLKGIGFVREDPIRYIFLSLSRIPIYFLFWPIPESTFFSNALRLLSFGLFLPFMIGGLLLAVSQWAYWIAPEKASSTSSNSIQLQFGHVTLLLAFILVYTSVHLASWANVRYRLPVDCFLILFAAYAINYLWHMFAGRGNKIAVSEASNAQS